MPLKQYPPYIWLVPDQSMLLRPLQPPNPPVPERHPRLARPLYALSVWLGR